MTHSLEALTLSLLTLSLLATGCGDSGGSNSGPDGGRTPCHPEQVALCDVHAGCELVLDTPVCTCLPGYEGNGVVCMDTDECARGIDECGGNATCVDTDGGYLCECALGFSEVGSSCIDDDECAQGTHDCDTNAACTNTPGGFTCACREGYMEDGKTCAIDVTTFLADVSGTPIALQINAIGDYLVERMGRLAVEVEYASSPGILLGQFERVPTGWRVHDLVLRDLRPGPSTLSALQGWASTSVPTGVVMTLEGPGAEVFTLSMTGVVPVAADTTVTDGRMRELVLAIDDIVVTAHTPAIPTSSPNTATVVQFSSLSCFPAMMPAYIDEATPFTAGPLRLREVGSYSMPGLGNSGALVTWMDGARDDLDTQGDIDREGLTQIHHNGSGNEIDRTNCFQAFPALLYYFNPTRPYGTTHLVDLEIAVEWCEAA